MLYVHAVDTGKKASTSVHGDPTRKQSSKEGWREGGHSGMKLCLQNIMDIYIMMTLVPPSHVIILDDHKRTL